MAQLVNNNNTTGNNNEQRKAEAYLNLEISAANGDAVRLPKGIALDSSTRIGRSIINAAKANPDAIFTLTGKVHVIDAEAEEQDIDLLTFGGEQQ